MKWAAIIIAGLVLLCLACLSLIVVALIAYVIIRGFELRRGSSPPAA